MTDRYLTLGWPGDSGRFRCWISKNLGIWWTSHSRNEELSDGTPYFWNPFGTDKPDEGKGNNIAVEINFARKGVCRRMTGVIAEDEKGRLYLMHRGRLKGGRNDVPTEKFDRMYGKPRVDLDDDGVHAQVHLVSQLATPNMAENVAKFVWEMRRLRGGGNGARVGEELKVEVPDEYRPEFAKAVSYKRSSLDVRAKFNHGIIVDALARAFGSPAFLKSNSRSFDLVACRIGHDKKVLFEVKTDANTTSQYEAVGQLFLYSKMLGKSPVMVAVMPNSLSPSASRLLESVGVRVLRFTLKGDKRVSFKSDPADLVRELTVS